MSKKPGFVPPPPPKEPNNNEQALSLNALRLMDESKIQGLLFEAIRGIYWFISYIPSILPL